MERRRRSRPSPRSPAYNDSPVPGRTGLRGLDFRSSADVLFKRVTLDACYELGTLPADAPEAQVILYDDVVVATSRIGCRTH